MKADHGSFTIEQSGLKQYGGVVLSLSGGIVFLVVAFVFGSQEPMALVGFGFFGVFMLLGGLVGLRRGSDRRLIEVGPEGIWLPGMGLLAWPAIREVRLEVVRGVGGGNNVAAYRRLGVVPLDPDLKPDAATRLGWGMFAGYTRLLRSLAPGVRFGAEDLAPFGLGEPEATGDEVDDALAVVRRYAPVVDAGEERAKERAARWSARHDTPRGDTTSGAPAADLRAIDERLGAAGRLDVGGPESFIQGSPQAPPSATFRMPPFSAGMAWRWLLAIVPLVGFVVFLASVNGGTVSGAGLLLLVVAMLIIIGPGVARFGPRALEAFRRGRMSEEERTVLRVGPDGIWLNGMGAVAWDRVRTVRALTEGSTPVGLSGQIPRWGLFVEPEPGAAPAGDWAVYADQLDTPFDDVVDLVRYYHRVEEIG